MEGITKHLTTIEKEAAENHSDQRTNPKAINEKLSSPRGGKQLGVIRWNTDTGQGKSRLYKHMRVMWDREEGPVTNHTTNNPGQDRTSPRCHNMWCTASLSITSTITIPVIGWVYFYLISSAVWSRNSMCTWRSSVCAPLFWANTRSQR